MPGLKEEMSRVQPTFTAPLPYCAYMQSGSPQHVGMCDDNMYMQVIVHTW